MPELGLEVLDLGLDLLDRLLVLGLLLLGRIHRVQGAAPGVADELFGSFLLLRVAFLLLERAQASHLRSMRFGVRRTWVRSLRHLLLKLLFIL